MHQDGASANERTDRVQRGAVELRVLDDGVGLFFLVSAIFMTLRLRRFGLRPAPQRCRALEE
jgi:hypothetical protein